MRSKVLLPEACYTASVHTEIRGVVFGALKLYFGVYRAVKTVSG